ncbi:MAG: hypothetical protein QM736_19170 [Vicinamibacterales bacterium]
MVLVRGRRSRMINYTDRLTLLMRDIVSRVSALSFIDMDDILVFARFGRVHTDGAFATCHCLNLPPSEPGYYFWRDRDSGAITRRSEWFVTKSPVVTVHDRSIKYLISFSLPRFCNQSLQRSRKGCFYDGDHDPWIAKLDTVVHELYHIDPEHKGIRRIERADGSVAAHCHTPEFFEQVVRMVHEYLATDPDPAIYDFLRDDLTTLTVRHGGLVGTSFRSFPSYPQRFIERLVEQPACDPSLAHVEIEPLRAGRRRDVYTEADLRLRRFTSDTSRCHVTRHKAA